MSTSSTMSNTKNVFSKYKSYFIFYITDLLKNRVDVDKDLTMNLKKVIKDIPKEKYENIISGAYKRPEKYVKKTSNRVRKLKEYL
jgi:hypothetical protein